MATYDIPVEAREIKFMVILNDIGSASFKILKSRLYQALPDVKMGDKFNIYIYETKVFTFVWDSIVEDELENGDFDITVSGTGVAGQLERIQLWPDRLKCVLNKSTQPYTYTYGEDVYVISSINVEGVYLRSQNNEVKIGKSVGEAWQYLLGEATYRNAIKPSIIGFGANDAGSPKTTPWDKFNGDGFKFNVGTSYLSILNEMAQKGFLYYRQEIDSIYFYNPMYPFNLIDISTEAYRCTGYSRSANIKKKFNSYLVLGQNIITSYRTNAISENNEIEGSIDVETDDIDMHVTMAGSFINDEDETKRITMYIQPGKEKNPVLSFTVGDRLFLDGKLNENRVLSISVMISDNTTTHAAEIEMSGDMSNDKNARTPWILDAKQNIDKLLKKANPNKSNIIKIKGSTDSQFIMTNDDGTKNTVVITDKKISIDDKVIDISELT